MIDKTAFISWRFMIVYVYNSHLNNVAVDYAFVVHTHTYELAHKYYIIMDTQ
jgi:hypothetical protein